MDQNLDCVNLMEPQLCQCKFPSKFILVCIIWMEAQLCQCNFPSKFILVCIIWMEAQLCQCNFSFIRQPGRDLSLSRLCLVLLGLSLLDHVCAVFSYSLLVFVRWVVVNILFWWKHNFDVGIFRAIIIL